MTAPRDLAYGFRSGNRLDGTRPRSLLVVTALLLICAVLLTTGVSAHPGRLAADGCHNDRKNGGRHCHRGSTAPRPQPKLNGDVYYPNCAAARAAGAAPVRRGHPGYASHLDRDNDGVGCE